MVHTFLVPSQALYVIAKCRQGLLPRPLCQLSYGPHSSRVRPRTGSRSPDLSTRRCGPPPSAAFRTATGFVPNTTIYTGPCRQGKTAVSRDILLQRIRASVCGRALNPRRVLFTPFYLSELPHTLSFLRPMAFQITRDFLLRSVRLCVEGRSRVHVCGTEWTLRDLNPGPTVYKTGALTY